MSLFDKVELQNAIESRKAQIDNYDHTGVSYPTIIRDVKDSKYDEGYIPIESVNPQLVYSDLEKYRGNNQSAWTQAGNALTQAASQVVGGTIEGFGYLDPSVIYHSFKGDEGDWSNALIDAGKALQTWTSEIAPIYKTYDEDKFSPGKWSWWMNNAPSVASTLSLLIPTMAVVRGVSTLGKAVGMTAELAKLSKALGGAAKPIINGIGQAIVSRYMENGMEASSNFKDIYDLGIQSGLSVDEAKKNASQSAADTWNKNWVMLAQDIPSYILLSTKFGKAAGAVMTPGIAKQLGEDVMKPMTKKVLAYSGDMISEGFEEAYQQVVSNHNVELAKHRIDPNYKPKGLEDLLQQSDVWTSAFWGALGSGVFQSAGRALNEKVLGRPSEEGERLKNVADFGPRMALWSKVMQKATNDGDEYAFNDAKSSLLNELAGKSAELRDLDKLEIFLDKAQESEASPELLEKFGLNADDVEYMKEKFPELKKQVQEFGKSYEQYTKQGFDPDIASELTKFEFNKKSLTQSKDRATKRLAEVEQGINELGRNELSIYGREVLDAKTDLLTLQRKRDFLQKRLSNKLDLSDDIKSSSEKELEDTKFKLDKLSTHLKELNKVEGYTKEDKDKDKAIIDRLAPKVKKGDPDPTPSPMAEYNKLKSVIAHKDMALAFADTFIQHAMTIQKGRNNETIERPKPPVQSEPVVEEEEEQGTPTESEVQPTPEKQQEIIEEKEDPDKKASRLMSTHGSKTINQLFNEGYNTLKDVNYFDKEGNQIVGTISKVGNSIVFPDENGNVTSITDKGDKDLRSLGYILTEDPTNENEPKPIPKYDIEDEEEEFITDIPAEGTNEVELDVDYSNNATSLDLGYITKNLTEANEVAEARKIDTYLSNPGELVGHTIEYYISNDPKFYKGTYLETLKKVQEGNFSKLTSNEINDIPVFCKLKDANGKVITDKIFLYKPLDLYNIVQTKYIRIPLDIQLLPTDKKAEAITKYFQSVRANNIKLRTQIVKNTIEGKTTVSNNLSKSRGLINNTGSNKKIKEALYLNPEEVRLFISKPDGNIYDGDGKWAGKHKGEINKSGGSVYLKTTKTANGDPIFVKLNPTKISTSHASLVLDVFRDAVVKGFKTPYESTGLTHTEALQFLVNHGSKTKVTNVPEFRREELISKQLFIENDKLYYGRDNALDLLNISKEDRDKFVDYLTHNMNYAITARNFNKGVKSFKLGEFEVTPEEASKGLTYQGLYSKLGMVKTDAGFQEGVKDSISRDVIVSVDLNSTEDLIVNKPTEVISTPKTDLDIKIEEIENRRQTELDLYKGYQPEKLSELAKERPEFKDYYTDLKQGTTPIYQSKQVIKKINAKYDAELTNLKESKSEVKPTAEVKKPGKSLKDVQKNIFGTANRLYTNQADYKLEDIDKITKWFKSTLGKNVPVHIVDDFIEVITKTGNLKAFGRVKDASLYLYNKAEQGTGYHEAFHIVSLYFLTDRQRTNMYNQARLSYSELKNSTDKQVEEYLAEKFREYMLTEEEVKPKSNLILDFFKKLYNRIINLFIDPTTRLSDLSTENLFNKIKGGYFKDSKVKTENSKKYRGYDYLRKVERFTVRQTRTITDNLMALVVRENNLTDVEAITKIKFEPVVTKLESIRDMYSSIDPESEDKELASHYVDVINRILNPETFKQFKRLVEDRFIAMNIHNTSNSIENDENESDSLEDMLRNSDKSVYEFNGRDNTLANIKLFLASLPESEEFDSFSGLPKILDFTTAWSRLLRDTHNALDIKEVQQIISTKSEKSYFYKVLLNGLKDGDGNTIRIGLKDASEDFQTQFFNSVNKYRHDYINVKQYQWKNGYDYQVFSSDIYGAQSDIIDLWGVKFYESGKYFDKSNNPIATELSKVITTFNNEILTPISIVYDQNKVIVNYNDYLDSISKLLNTIGINLSADILDDICYDLSPVDVNYGLFQLTNDILNKILGSQGILKSIALGKTKVNQVERYFKDEKGIKELASLVVKLDDNYINDTVLGPDNTTFYSYSQHSFITYYNKYLFQDKQFLSNLSNVISNNNSQFLKQIRDGKNVTLKTYSSFRDKKNNKGYLDITPQQDMLSKIHLILKGYLPMPTLADKKTYFVYEGMDTYKLDSYHKDDVGRLTIPDNLYNIFHGYYLDETNRINQVKNDIDNAIEEFDYRSLIQGMHYQNITEEGIPILTDSKGEPLYDSNGMRYQLFTDFNGKDRSKHTKEAIVAAVQDNIISTLKLAEENGIIKINSKDGKLISLTNKLLDSKEIANRNKPFSETGSVYSILAEYAVNSMISNIETQKLFIMDPAYYKRDKATDSTIEDMIKRLSSLIAPGDQLRTNYETGEFSKKPEIYTNADKYRVITLQDHIVNMFGGDPKLSNKLMTTFFNLLREQFPELSTTKIKDMVADRMSAYTSTNATDAQVYITPAFHRELLKRLGEWTSQDQEAYELLTSGRKLTKAEQVKAGKLITQPLKFVHYGVYFENRYGIPVYDKMSLATLWPSMVKGTKLEVLHNRMTSEDSPIDMVKFESAVKAGNRMRIKYINKEGGVNEDILNTMDVFEQDLKYLRRQQVTDPHEDEERSLATQVKKIVLANLHLDKNIYNVDGEDSPVTGKDIADGINTVYSVLSNKGLKSLQEKLGIGTSGLVDKEKLYNTLREAATASNMPYQVIDALLYEDGKPIVNLDVLSDRKWIESKLISVVNKNTIDLMTPGDGFTQMSNFGLQKLGVSDDLQLMDDQGRMEVKLSVGFYKNVIPNYNNLTFTEKRNFLLNNKDLLEGIGYRIPTKSQSSCISFIVKDVLDESTGNTIILPLYFTALTGSDFDIDKLFLARYSYYTKGNDLFKYEFIKGDEGNLATQNGTLEQLYQQNYREQVWLHSRLQELSNELLNSINDESLVKTLLDNRELNIFKEVLDKGEFWNEDKITKEDVDVVLSKLLSNLTLEEYKEQNRGKDVHELNSYKALQNQVINLMKAVLTNPEHTLDTKTPIDAFTGKLKDIVKELRKLRGEAKVLSSLKSTSPGYQLSIKQAYNGGKNGIGPFALNTVHHALGQIYNLGIKSPLDATGIVSLAKKYGVDKIAIEDWLSALINAHVDIAKDPYIFDLNVNKSTYDVTNFMIRAGYGENSFWYLTQPILQNLPSKLTEETINNLNNEYKTKAVSLARAEEIDSTKVQEYIDNNMSIESVLNSNLKDNINVKTVHDWKWYANQYIIFNNYIKIKEAAGLLSKAVSFSRIDNKGFGTNMMEVYAFDRSLSMVLKDDQLVNFDKLINSSFLGTMRSNSIKTILEAYKNLTLTSTKGFRNISDSLSSLLPKADTNEELRNRGKSMKSINNEIYSSLVGKYFVSSTGFGLSKESIKKLFVGKDSVGSRLYTIVKAHPDLANNELIKNFIPIEDTKDNAWFIKAKIGDKSDKWIKDVVTDAWEELLNDTRQDVKDLARDLIYASFYNSGFNRKLYSYHHYIPISKLLEEPKLFDGEIGRSFNKYITDMLQYLNSEDIDISFIDSVEDDVKSNNPELFENGALAVEQYPIYTINHKPAFFVGDVYNIIGYNSNDKPIYNTYDRSGTHLGVFIGLLNNKPVYKIISKKGISYSGHYFKEYGYKGSVIDSNNNEVFTEQQILASPKTKGIDYIQPSDRIVVKDYIPEDKSMREEKQFVFKGKMTFSYGSSKRSDITSDTTIQAIQKGERTATTRYESDGHLVYWKSAKIGDIIEFEGIDGQKVNVEVTNPLTKLDANTSAEEWSKKEGWSVDYFNSKVKPKLTEAWQIEYKLITDKQPIQPTKIFNKGTNKVQPTEEQQKIFDSMPEKIKSDPEMFEQVKNAIMNMNTEELKVITDLLNNC